jgi:hypothetical protein
MDPPSCNICHTALQRRSGPVVAEATDLSSPAEFGCLEPGCLCARASHAWPRWGNRYCIAQRSAAMPVAHTQITRLELRVRSVRACGCAMGPPPQGWLPTAPRYVRPRAFVDQAQYVHHPGTHHTTRVYRSSRAPSYHASGQTNPNRCYD